MSLETFGSIIKEERLKTVERGIISNTLVLENLGMFPGYYGAGLPDNQMPDSLFIVTVNTESTEKILRVTHNIKKLSGYHFEGAAASICVNNTTYAAVRIRGLVEIEHIGELQEFYRDAGIELMKAKNIEAEGVIQVKKIFKLTEATPGIFQADETAMHYLKINKQLTWSQFRMITKEVRNNVTLPAYDAALGIFYASEIHDVVRVYFEKMNLDEMKELQLKYIEIIEKRIK